MDLKFENNRLADKSLNNSRSRSFLVCLSKHLGKHFLHNHRQQQDGKYKSQDDIHSSSTDSFSLSLDRSSRFEGHFRASSSIDLSSNSQSSSSDCSRLSSALMYSVDTFNEYGHSEQLYGEPFFRISNSFEHVNELSSDEEEHINHISVAMLHSKPRTAPVTASTTPRSRISISSSVSRFLHHFSSSSGRSVSCSNTPVRHSPAMGKTSKSSKNKNCQDMCPPTKTVNQKTNTTKSCCQRKKEKKPTKSILRPPIHFTYMKGMSGLYSRVPSYSVCSPYVMH